VERLHGGRRALTSPRPRKVNVSAYIEQEDLEKLEDLSRQTGESISAMICLAVKKYLQEKSIERGGKA
jgi:hypothetical protein